MGIINCVREKKSIYYLLFGVLLLILFHILYNYNFINRQVLFITDVLIGIFVFVFGSLTLIDLYDCWKK